jgi:hypothetical protein
MHALDINSNHARFLSLMEEVELFRRDDVENAFVFVNEPVTMTNRQKKIAKPEMRGSSSYNNDARGDDDADDDAVLYNGASGRISDDSLKRAS